MVIDGKQLSQRLKDEMREQVAELTRQYGRAPRLDVIIVGENPASQTYVRNKVKAAEYVGMEGRLIELPASITEEELLSTIAAINTDEAVDGLLVQLPLPKHIHEQAVIDAIAPEKDVDGFHPMSKCVPCTPAGIIELIASTGVDMKGKNAVVIGRSNIVGRPVAKLLLDRDCTVTIAHSKTVDLPAVCQRADILVVAIGRAKMIGAQHVAPGAIVIDVGINRIEDPSTATGTRLVGDVDYDAVSAIAGAITPVPGGVGPMTITMLMRNTIDCFRRKMN